MFHRLFFRALCILYWFVMVFFMVCLPAQAQEHSAVCAVTIKTDVALDKHSKTVRTVMTVQAEVKNFVAYRTEVDFGTTRHHNWKQLWKARKTALLECEKQLETADLEKEKPKQVAQSDP